MYVVAARERWFRVSDMSICLICDVADPPVAFKWVSGTHWVGMGGGTGTDCCKREKKPFLQKQAQEERWHVQEYHCEPRLLRICSPRLCKVLVPKTLRWRMLSASGGEDMKPCTEVVEIAKRFLAIGNCGAKLGRQQRAELFPPPRAIAYLSHPCRSNGSNRCGSSTVTARDVIEVWMGLPFIQRRNWTQGDPIFRAGYPGRETTGKRPPFQHPKVHWVEFSFWRFRFLLSFPLDCSVRRSFCQSFEAAFS